MTKYTWNSTTATSCVGLHEALKAYWGVNLLNSLFLKERGRRQFSKLIVMRIIDVQFVNSVDSLDNKIKPVNISLLVFYSGFLFKKNFLLITKQTNKTTTSIIEKLLINWLQY
jgi:hypothetical protein